MTLAVILRSGYVSIRVCSSDRCIRCSDNARNESVSAVGKMFLGSEGIITAQLRCGSSASRYQTVSGVTIVGFLLYMLHVP